MAGQTLGRSSRRFRRLSKNLRVQRLPCCRCGQPIDYTASHPDPRSFSVEHIKSWSKYPHLREDPANLDAAHLGCNSSRGARDDKPGLGETTRAW